MEAMRATQNSVGTWGMWEMAGPEMEASKRKEDPSTCSPTRKPTAASMAVVLKKGNEKRKKGRVREN